MFFFEAPSCHIYVTWTSFFTSTTISYDVDNFQKINCLDVDNFFNMLKDMLLYVID